MENSIQEAFLKEFTKRVIQSKKTLLPPVEIHIPIYVPQPKIVLPKLIPDKKEEMTMEDQFQHESFQQESIKDKKETTHEDDFPVPRPTQDQQPTKPAEKPAQQLAKQPTQQLIPQLPKKIVPKPIPQIHPQMQSMQQMRPKPVAPNRVLPMAPPHRLIPPPMPQSQDVKTLTVQELIEEGLGKLAPFLMDPAVISVECSGPGKPLMINRSGAIQTANITLTAEEIKATLQTVSRLTKVPLTEGIFKALAHNLIITAVISELIGSRFIVQKRSPFS